MDQRKLQEILNSDISGYPGIQVGADFVCAECVTEDEVEAAVFPGNIWGPTCDRCGCYVGSGMDPGV